MSPTISIIMPVYNVEKYLRECLDSVQGQTFTDWECICVDDGSTDSSSAILDEYAAKDQRFHVFKQQNKGSGPARNLALDNSSGECVCFVDPDDKYPTEDVLAKMYATLIDSKCKVVGGNLRLITDDGVLLHDVDYGYNGIMSYNETQQQYGYQCYLFARDLLEDNSIRFPVLWRRQDPPFFVRCMLAAKRFYAMKEVVYTYRMRNATRQVDWLANGGVRLKDNLSGIELVGELAKENGLWRLYAHNFQCLADGTFSRSVEIEVVMTRLRKFVKSVVQSRIVPYADVIKVASKMLQREESRIKRYCTITKVFGFAVLTHILLAATKRRIYRILRGSK